MAKIPEIQPEEIADPSVSETKTAEISKPVKEEAKPAPKQNADVVKQAAISYRERGFAPDLAESNAQKIGEFLSGKSNGYDIFHPRNKESRSVFEEITGKKLPKLVGTTNQFLDTFDRTAYSKTEEVRALPK